jgi:hypothetical protein
MRLYEDHLTFLIHSPKLQTTWTPFAIKPVRNSATATGISSPRVVENMAEKGSFSLLSQEGYWFGTDQFVWFPAEVRFPHMISHPE